MNTVDIIVEEETGLEFPPDELSLEYIKLVLDFLNLEDKEISIVLTGDASISKLNKMYRDKEGSTDILSFCQNDEINEFSTEIQSKYLGDIIISIDALKRNTKYFQVAFEEELNRLLIHGILHLIGMDHETNNSDEKMLLLQEKILVELKQGSKD